MQLASFLRNGKLYDLNDEVLCESVGMKIDRENHIIRGVKLLGRESKNGYEYTDRAIEQACQLYESMSVSISHDRANPDRERGVEESPGIIKNTRTARDGGYGDFHYLESHPLTPLILERVERGMPIGFSHNARGGQPVKRGNKSYIESVKQVKSLDIVLKPATTTTFFESESTIVSATVKDILTANKAAYPKLKLLIEEVVGDAMMSEAPVEMPAEANADEQIKAAFRSAVVAAFDDDSLDAQATLSKIKEILKSYDKLTGKESEDKPADAPTEDTSVAESIKALLDASLTPLLESVNELKHEKIVRKVMDSFGITPTAIGADRYALIESQKDEASMIKLIKSWPPGVRGAQRPTAKLANLIESEAPKAPKTAAGVMSYLRS